MINLSALIDKNALFEDVTTYAPGTGYKRIVLGLGW